MMYKNPAFCPAPWTSIYVGPTGLVDSCCISKNELGSVNDDPAQSINGKKNFEIKQSMLDGKFVEGCRPCNQPPGVKTLKDVYAEWFNDQPPEMFSDPNNFSLKYIDLRWRNTCNSACVYCGDEYSSLWAQLSNTSQKFNNDKIDLLKSFVEPNISGLERVYLAGGEPLLIKENEWFLERLLHSNPACKIRVNTNLNAIDNPVFELLTQFNEVQWIISGETVGDKYEYIRYGSKWDVFQSNIERLQQKVGHKNHDVTFLMVYCALSAPYMIDYIKFLRSKGLYNSSIGYYNQGTGGWCDPRNLPAQIEQRCKDQIREFLQQNTDIPHDLANTLNSMLVMMESPYQKDAALLEKNLARLDKDRNLDSRKVFPEIYQ